MYEADTRRPQVGGFRHAGHKQIAVHSAGNAGGFMNGFNKFLAATFLSAAMLLTSAAQAMEIQQFDKMAQDDRAEYVSALIQGAEKVLTDESRSDLAAQVSHLFTTNAPGDKISIGMTEFYLNLAILRVSDTENAQKNPKDPRVEVEDAKALTLQKNHIELPDSFYTIASNFEPKHAQPAKEDKKKDDKNKN